MISVIRKSIKSIVRFGFFKRCPYCGYSGGGGPDSGECPSCGEVS